MDKVEWLEHEQLQYLFRWSGLAEYTEYSCWRDISQIIYNLQQSLGFRDEMVFKFTHNIQMDWMLPGIAPTGKRVEVPLMAIIQFRDGKVAHEHIYWDQASVLVQLGLLDPGTLPVVGADSARKLLDPNLPSNTLIN